MAQSLPQTETFPESAASTKPKISRLSWRALIFLFFLGAIGFADKSIGTVIAVPISSEFKLNPTQWGIISGSFFWLFSISALVLGAWSDRIGTKRVLSLLAAIWSLAQFLAIFTGSFLTFLLTRVLLGIGEGPYTGVAITEASRWVPRVRRGFALAVVTCGGLVGPAVLTPIMVIVMARVGWRSVFLILGLSSVIWLVAWLFFGKEAPLEEPERETSVSAAKERIAWSSLWHILRSPAVLLITLASFGAYWM